MKPLTEACQLGNYLNFNFFKDEFTMLTKLYIVVGKFLLVKDIEKSWDEKDKS